MTLLLTQDPLLCISLNAKPISTNIQHPGADNCSPPTPSHHHTPSKEKNEKHKDLSPFSSSAKSLRGRGGLSGHTLSV